MPNWCNNYVEVSHEDPVLVQDLTDALNRGEFCNHVIPTPRALTETVAGFVGESEREAHEAQMARNLDLYGAKDWYDFQVNHWGTKWDVGGDSQADISNDGKTMTASFESAWGPPIGVYEALVDQGYQIRAYYYEPGMGFAGIYDNGQDDCYQDWGDSKGAATTLPQDLDEMFGISENQAQYEEENEEDLHKFVREGGEKLGLTTL